MLFTPTIMLKQLKALLYLTSGKYNSKLKEMADKGQSVILMYHRILLPLHTDEHLEPGMYVKPETFKMHISLLKDYFKVVSLHELFCTFKEKHSKPLCAITFDDGWMDFYENAYPILCRNEIPASIFLPTNFIGTEKKFWTDRLADILKKLPASTEKISNIKNENYTDKIKQLRGTLFSRVDNAIKLLKPLSLDNIDIILTELETGKQISNTVSRRFFLNWDECRELKNSGLITFGSHTADHIIMTSENLALCKSELENSRKKLIAEQLIDPSFVPFCYPNGSYNSEITSLLMNAGYSCAVTTKRGYVDNQSDCYLFNRIGIHQDMTDSKAMFLSRIL